MDKYTIKCDRCGKIENRVSVPHVSVTVPHVTISEELGNDYWQSVLIDWDLCGDCLQELKRFMNEPSALEAVR